MNDLPTGFAMALAANEAALRRFAGLSDDIRQEIVMQARQARSQEEMQKIVRNLV